MKYIISIGFVFSLLNSFSQGLLIDYSEVYIVIADSSSDFVDLDSKAFAVSKVLEVDYYDNKKFDSEKGLIYSDEVIAENKHDYIEYSHRRFATNDASVERVYPYFTDLKQSKSMLVIAGMFYKQDEADKALFEIIRFFPNAFIHKKEMYLGCEH